MTEGVAAHGAAAAVVVAPVAVAAGETVVECAVVR